MSVGQIARRIILRVSENAMRLRRQIFYVETDALQLDPRQPRLILGGLQQMIVRKIFRKVLGIIGGGFAQLRAAIVDCTPRRNTSDQRDQSE